MIAYTCQDVIDLLAEYTDGALADDARAQIDQHLTSCASCAAFVRSYLAVPELFREHTGRTMPDDVRARLERVLAEHDKPH